MQGVRKSLMRRRRRGPAFAALPCATRVGLPAPPHKGSLAFYAYFHKGRRSQEQRGAQLVPCTPYTRSPWTFAISTCPAAAANDHEHMQCAAFAGR